MPKPKKLDLMPHAKARKAPAGDSTTLYGPTYAQAAQVAPGGPGGPAVGYPLCGGRHPASTDAGTADRVTPKPIPAAVLDGPPAAPASEAPDGSCLALPGAGAVS